MALARSDLDNMELHSDHAFACFVACLQVAWDKFRTEEHPDDQLFVVARLQTVGILDLVEALSCLLRSRHSVERCMP